MIVTKVQASHVLADVDPQYVFWLCDGAAIKNARELLTALSRIDDASYAYHANEQKNDFSSWTRDILHDPKLASDLRKARNRAEAMAAVKSRISWLDRKAIKRH